mgnify:CR=1 FL=1
METKVIRVGSAKGSRSGNRRRPSIRLSGFWLGETGFESGKLITVKYDHGSILIRAHKSDKYRNLVRGKSGAGLFQVRSAWRNKKLVPSIDIKGFRLEPLGFAIGSVIAVQYEHGFIKIRLIDLKTRGLLS